MQHISVSNFVLGPFLRLHSQVGPAEQENRHRSINQHNSHCILFMHGAKELI